MSNEPKRPYYDKQRGVLFRAAEAVARLPVEAVKLGVTIIVNNDGSKQQYKPKKSN